MPKKSSPKKSGKNLKKIKSFSFQDIGAQAVIAICSGVTLFALAIMYNDLFATNPSAALANTHAIDIGIEHEAPVHMEILIGRKDAIGQAHIAGDARASIYVSVPSEWKLIEMKGERSRDEEVSEFGFTRIKIAPNGAARFDVPVVPDAITFFSPNDSTAAIDIETVNIETLERNSETVLLQSESFIELWRPDDV